MFHQLTLIAVPDFPLVEPGNELASMICDACLKAGIALSDGDVVVIAQKIVSKAEGRYVNLGEVIPSAQSQDVGQSAQKGPAARRTRPSESTQIIRAQNGVLIVAHRLGYIMANAGIDQSNISHAGGERALLLPADPDGSAADINKSSIAAFQHRMRRGESTIVSAGRGATVSSGCDRSRGRRFASEFRQRTGSVRAPSPRHRNRRRR